MSPKISAAEYQAREKRRVDHLLKMSGIKLPRCLQRGSLFTAIYCHQSAGQAERGKNHRALLLFFY